VISVFIVDDQALVRAGFALVIGSQPDLCVVGQATDGADAVQQLRTVEADVVLMDIQMPRLDGVAATEQIFTELGAERAPRILMLTTFDLDEYAYRALRAGASGFLLKDVPPEDLLAAVRSVALGETVVAPSTTRRLIERYAAATGRDPEAGRTLAQLTARERDILTGIARGRSNPEIAADLFLSEATVKTHVGRILAKTGRRDRVALVILAYDSGLAGPGQTRPTG
jgi:DNA-binding NarL/FixJ family response regulator